MGYFTEKLVPAELNLSVGALKTIRAIKIKTLSMYCLLRGTQRQFLENICSEDDLRSRIFGTFVVKFLACLPLLGFSNISKMV